MSLPVESLILFKRHRDAACPVHKSKVPRASRRFWFECGCPFFIYGMTPSGQVVDRQTTGTSDPKQAEALRQSLLLEAKADPVSGLPVADCIQKYLTSREADLDARTLGQYRLVLERLRRYLEREGVLYIRQMTVDHLESFKTAGLPKEMESTSRALTDSKIRCFLKTAFRRDWIAEALVLKVLPVRAVYEQKEPYTDEEVAAILKEALNLDGGTHGYATQPQTFQLLLVLMLTTGLRVGDAVSFDPRRLEKGEHLWVYTFEPQKSKKVDQPKVLEAFLPASLKERIMQCRWLSPQRPFWYGAGVDPTPLAQAVYERMQSIGARAGIADCRPHRLRDTFAVRKLAAGAQLEDVSRLLGHSSVKVTEKYYAKWVTSRKRRLERIVSESGVDGECDALWN